MDLLPHLKRLAHYRQWPDPIPYPNKKYIIPVTPNISVLDLRDNDVNLPFLRDHLIPRSGHVPTRDIMMIITQNEVTSDAKEYAMNNRIEILNYEDIAFSPIDSYYTNYIGVHTDFRLNQPTPLIRSNDRLVRYLGMNSGYNYTINFDHGSSFYRKLL